MSVEVVGVEGRVLQLFQNQRRLDLRDHSFFPSNQIEFLEVRKTSRNCALCWAVVAGLEQAGGAKAWRDTTCRTRSRHLPALR